VGCAAAVAIGLAAVACGDDGGGPPPDEAAADEVADATEAAAPAPVPGGEWQVETPESQGMDAAVLEEARAYAFADDMNTQGVVVVRNGVIVAEWYADGADETSWATSWSVAKSFTSALIGIAIDEGLIPGVDEPMTTWYPEWRGSERESMTLRDVLQMSSGLDWVESYDPATTAESDIIQLVVGAQDQLAVAAAQPAKHEPGTVWSYSSGDTMLLSGVLQQATGMRPDEYAQRKLFEPIGMEQVEWWRDAAGHTLTYCCLDTTGRDYARFGLLYLREGAWGDEPVVPRAWVADSLEPVPHAEAGYGFQWWLDQPDTMPEDLFSANGHDGQFIYVVPSLDLVVVRNGTYVKDPGEPIAEPNLFAKLPPQGLVPGRGSVPPEGDWDMGAFLNPIVESITDE
jgi:CubicO group peptidase (beta-lactamase class C family)